MVDSHVNVRSVPKVCRCTYTRRYSSVSTYVGGCTYRNFNYTCWFSSPCRFGQNELRRKFPWTLESWTPLIVIGTLLSYLLIFIVNPLSPILVRYQAEARSGSFQAPSASTQEPHSRSYYQKLFSFVTSSLQSQANCFFTRPDSRQQNYLINLNTSRANAPLDRQYSIGYLEICHVLTFLKAIQDAP